MLSAAREVNSLKQWREAARDLLRRDIPPGEVLWVTADSSQALLPADDVQPIASAKQISIPAAFFRLADDVALHSDPNRWSLLYRLAWRLTHGERNLLKIDIDDDMVAANAMSKAVHHDVHKMRAFVRFRKVQDELGEQFVAWYRPEHHILEFNSKFFVERFRGMRWAILTPRESAFWDMNELRFGPGVPREQAPADDQLEDLWRAYYSSIYNPSRLNIPAMRAQLPAFRWEDLPEARMIPELVRESPGRLVQMAGAQPRSAAEFVPAGATLTVLASAVRHCGACPLCARATGAVFGEGPETARIMLVGECPGDEEDRTGRPFVGPAGQVLDQALQNAGVDRSQVYVTNAVKAFQFIERGKRRIHQTPRASDIAVCRPWLMAETSALNPDVIVCLGGSAAQAVMGRTVRINAERGRALEHHLAKAAIVTFHPSALLRAPDPVVQAQQREWLAADLALAKTLVSQAA